MLPDEYIPLPNQTIQKQAHSVPKRIEVIPVELAQTAQLPSKSKPFYGIILSKINK